MEQYTSTPLPVSEPAPPPATSGPLIVTASREPSPAERQQIERIPRRFPGFLWILVPPVVMYLISSPLQLLFPYAPQARAIESAVVLFASWIAALIWWLCRRKRTAAKLQRQPILTGYRRIEVHAQGVVCRGERERTVIPFDEVTAFWELNDKMVLFGRSGYIFWRTTELTAAETGAILETVCAHLPQGTHHRKGLGGARIFLSLPLPALPQETVPQDATEGKLFSEGTLRQRFRRLFSVLGAPLLAMCGVVAALLGGVFVWQLPLLQSSVVWLAILALLVAPLALWLALWLDDRGERKKAPAVTVWRTANGVRVSDGRNEREYPLEQVRLCHGRRTLLYVGESAVVLNGDLPDPTAPRSEAEPAPIPQNDPTEPENFNNEE